MAEKKEKAEAKPAKPDPIAAIKERWCISDPMFDKKLDRLKSAGVTREGVRSALAYFVMPSQIGLALDRDAAEIFGFIKP